MYETVKSLECFITNQPHIAFQCKEIYMVIQARVRGKKKRHDLTYMSHVCDLFYLIINFY